MELFPSFFLLKEDVNGKDMNTNIRKPRAMCKCRVKIVCDLCLKGDTFSLKTVAIGMCLCVCVFRMLECCVQIKSTELTSPTSNLISVSYSVYRYVDIVHNVVLFRILCKFP